jgi:hypothetical protein
MTIVIIYGRTITLLYPSKIHGDGHHGKCEGHYNGKAYAYRIQQMQVTVIMQAQGPKGALKAMQQVICQGYTGQNIKDDDPKHREGIFHDTKHIMDLGPIAISDGSDIHEPGRDPEMLPMKDKEDQDDRPQ